MHNEVFDLSLELPQFSPTLIRAVAVLVPFGAALILFMVHQPKPRAAGGMLLATLWNLVALLALNLLAAQFGWWHFNASKATFLDIPTDLYLGWAVLWGALSMLALPKMRLELMILILAVVDLVYMPLAFPVVQLESGWLIGEAVCLVCAAIPAQLLGRWTRDSLHLYARVGLQMLLFTGLYFFVIAALVLEVTHGSWTRFLANPVWFNILLGIFSIFPGILAVNSVLEFARFGRGTPFPWDSPDHLVTTGPYAFIKNPMQFGASLLALIWGAFLGSWELMLASVMAIAFSASIAKWQEHSDLEQRFSDAYLEYHSRFRNWIPRWRLWQAHSSRLQLIAGSRFLAWYKQQNPVFLTLEQGSTLEYQSDERAPELGIDAVARALEHLNLVWAALGWMLKLPLIKTIVKPWFTASIKRNARDSREL